MSEEPRFTLDSTYVSLQDDGVVRAVAGGSEFWKTLGTQDEVPGVSNRSSRLVMQFSSSQDWAHWEMHPAGDELVCLLKGAVTLQLERDGGVQECPMTAGQTVIVPRGVWHTARVHEPSELLHVTQGAGTKHRPVKDGELSPPGSAT